MKHDQSNKLLRAACQFQGQGLQARASCREQFRNAEQESDNSLRILIDGQIALLAETIAEKIEGTTPAISYQLGVSASFIRTHFIISDLIFSGDLVEAIILIRKQLESLARLHELDSKPLEKLAGKVPNIQNILKKTSGRLYGELSEVAHFSRPRVAELLHVAERGELIGPSLFPVYSERSKACFDMCHFVTIYFLGWITEKLPTWYSEYDNSEEKLFLGNTILMALHTGAIGVPDDRDNSSNNV